MECVRAAQQFLDANAVLHPAFAGNCFDTPITERCMAGGLGPNEFDCSGLVIASFAAVMDVPVDRWRDLRHVRDLWKVAGEAGLHRSAYAVGDLLVIPRTYTISGNRQSVPGHIGFVTKVDSGGLNILHADWRQETVVESFRPRALPIFGAISLAKEVLLSRY